MKYFVIILSSLYLYSCQKEVENKMVFESPSNFPEVTYNFDKNPITDEGFALGKQLFGDPILSVDNSIACNNCHVKGVAFTDPQHTLSLGVNERHGTRNAPSIANMAFMKEFLWDGGIVHLDFVPTNAIENFLEMDEKLSHVVYKLNQNSDYKIKFKAAFPELDTITGAYLLKALSQYQLMLISASSKYDKYVQGKVDLSSVEKQSIDVFKAKCGSCHSGELFTNQGYFNNGLDSIYMDDGRMRISESVEDQGKFRVPSLRNVALTDPYMHDGRFKTLEDVLNHYSSGVVYSKTLANELQLNGQLGIPLSKAEKESIIIFLNLLTDYDFISDQRF